VPVKQNRARAALAVIATFLRSRQPQVLAQRIEQGSADIDRHAIIPIIDLERKIDRRPRIGLPRRYGRGLRGYTARDDGCCRRRDGRHQEASSALPPRRTIVRHRKLSSSRITLKRFDDGNRRFARRFRKPWGRRDGTLGPLGLIQLRREPHLTVTERVMDASPVAHADRRCRADCGHISGAETEDDTSAGHMPSLRRPSTPVEIRGGRFGHARSAAARLIIRL
jgi:hypothetical protein